MKPFSTLKRSLVSTIKSTAKSALIAGISTCLIMPSLSQASSHREAPFITTMPRLDGTDFYMFRSYEEGREDTVTLVSNYLPLQDAYGGPNYFDLEDDARYEIHIDNNGDAEEDITFRFRFSTLEQNLAIPINGVNVEVPLKNIGQIGPSANDTGNVNVRQTYKLDIIRGDRRFGRRQQVRGADGTRDFRKPLDNIGNKSIPDYPSYAASHVYDIDIPGCDSGRVFVGQRREGFAVNLGEVFDLVNISLSDLLGPQDQGLNIVANKNITSLALEIPIACLTDGQGDVIGGWMSASIPQARLLNRRPHDRYGASVEGGPFIQVSRLGMPLVNEVVIGLGDKDRFNHSEPKNDSQFANYVTNPTLPELINILFLDDARAALAAPDLPTIAPTNFPRNDLVTAFLTGFPGVNQLPTVTPSEMQRLNTAIAPTPADEQKNFGVVVGDLAGFPNGRRPGDDALDISLRVAMGALCHPVDLDGDGNPTDNLGLCSPADANAGNLPLTDGAAVSANDFLDSFPYLTTPVSGSPSPLRLAP